MSHPTHKAELEVTPKALRQNERHNLEIEPDSQAGLREVLDWSGAQHAGTYSY